MAWWRQARFGMFIHWGLYSIPAGTWDDRTDHGEWIRDSAQIPVATYERFQPQWNPVKFDAEKWATMAAKAGMKYLVLTSKHHDGFCLFDSKQTDWDVMNTPSHRDVCKELAAACKRHGIAFCTYYSIMDWRHPDYLPRRPWERATRPEAGADFARFERFLHAQVTEVIEQYHPAVMWFDGEWENTWTHERGVALFDLCRRLAPGMIVNNRVDVHRGGMGGFSDAQEAKGDFATPEQEIPAIGVPGVDWESCMTMNRHWGWNAADTDWKTSKELVQNLIDIAGKGGNYLLNVGPRADGTFPDQAVERLREIGRWMDENGESIHGTTASVFDKTPWGRCTVRAGDKVSTLYLHVFADGDNVVPLPLPGLANKVRSVRVLGGRGHCSPMPKSGEREKPDYLLTMTRPDPIATVVAVEIEGRPDVTRTPKVVAESELFVHHIDVKVEQPSPNVVTTFTVDGSAPIASSPRANSIIRIEDSCLLRTASFRDGELATAVVVRPFRKVDPSPAVEPVATRPGLHLLRRDGVDWQTIPDDRAGFAPATPDTTATVTLPKAIGEHVALRMQGFLDAPDDDLYRFALTSDDGSKLWIDGELVVDNDGLHSTAEKRGERALGKGLHPIEVVWFNRTGDVALSLGWARAGAAFEPVPAAALRH